MVVQQVLLALVFSPVLLVLVFACGDRAGGSASAPMRTKCANANDDPAATGLTCRESYSRDSRDKGSMEQVLSFDLRDKTRIDVSHSRGGWPRLSVSSADADDKQKSAEVEFVHTVDSDPRVSLEFFRALSDQAQRAADDLADLVGSDDGDAC